jgi:hypothetical protein
MTRWRSTYGLLIALAALVAPPAFADGEFSLPHIAADVLRDPTTYAPAALAYEGLRLDWDSSQPLFARGWLEDNSQFTASGLPHSQPTSYRAGNREVAVLTLVDLGASAAHNASSRIVEHWLSRRFPDHPKLVKTVGWIERIGVASYLASVRAAPHYQQWQRNRALLREAR